jgi:hypothetical protein
MCSIRGTKEKFLMYNEEELGNFQVLWRPQNFSSSFVIPFGEEKKKMNLPRLPDPKPT